MEIAAIAAIIGAAAGAASGLSGTIQNGVNAYGEAEAKQQYITNMYLLNLARANEEFIAAKEEAEKNAKYANQQADLSDLGQDITERAASADFNTAIDNLYLSQASDTLSWNQQAMQAASSEGAGLAALSGSGVRAGSSLSDAVLMESAVNENQLQFSQDAKRKSDNNNLAAVLNNLAGTEYGIMQNRVGADITRERASDLVNSYLEGGHNYNLYQLQTAQMSSEWLYNWNTLQREKERWWKNGFISWDAFWTGATNMLGMGAKGASTGYNLYDTTYKAMNYNKSLKTTAGGDD